MVKLFMPCAQTTRSGVGELGNIQQLGPLLPADDREALAIVRHIGCTHHLEGCQHLRLSQTVSVGAGKIGGGVQRRDDQLVGLAAQGISAGIGDDLALVDVDLHLVQLVDPVAGIIVGQDTLDRGVVDRHHRHQAMTRLGRRRTLADLLERGGRAFHLALRAHGLAQFRAHPLIGLMHLGLELADEGLVNGYRHRLLILDIG
jgi:hypothetical protein